MRRLLWIEKRDSLGRVRIERARRPVLNHKNATLQGRFELEKRGALSWASLAPRHPGKGRTAAGGVPHRGRSSHARSAPGWNDA